MRKYILILVLGLALAVANFIGARQSLNTVCGPSSARFSGSLGMFTTGWMVSWALFEGFFPLIGL